MKRAALALAVAVAVAVVLMGGSDDVRTVRAEFSQTNELRKGDLVRVAGVNVGKVASIALRPARRTAVATLHITSRRVVVSRQARADLRWSTLLGGNLYVDLSPGHGAATDWIPRSRTSSQVEFDDVTQVFAGRTPAALRAQLRALRTGLSQPRSMRALLAEVPPASRAVRDGASPLLGDRDDDLRALVASTARTTRALTTDRGRLAGVVRGAGATLGATGAASGALGAAIERTPASLREVRRTTARLDRTLDLLDPLASDLRPGARRLDGALAQADPMLRSAASLLTRARPLLRDLSPTVASLAGAGRVGTPLLRDLQPTLARLDDELLPWLGRTDPTTQRSTAEMIGPALSAAAGAASEFDGEGYWLRFAPIGGERLLLSAPCQTFFTDPSVTEKVRCDALEGALKDILRPRSSR